MSAWATLLAELFPDLYHCMPALSRFIASLMQPPWQKAGYQFLSTFLVYFVGGFAGLRKAYLEFNICVFSTLSCRGTAITKKGSAHPAQV